MNVEEMKHTLHELIVKGAVGYENEFDKKNFTQMKYFPIYEISERGIIRNSYTGRIVKQKMNKYGVRCVSLYKYADDRVEKTYPVWHFERSPFG